MSTSKSIINVDVIKTICQGALGSVTFEAYHQFQTNKQMELNNKQMELNNEILKLQHQHDMDKRDKEISILNEKVNNMEELLKRKSWW